MSSHDSAESAVHCSRCGSQAVPDQNSVVLLIGEASRVLDYCDPCADLRAAIIPSTQPLPFD